MESSGACARARRGPCRRHESLPCIRGVQQRRQTSPPLSGETVGGVRATRAKFAAFSERRIQPKEEQYMTGSFRRWLYIVIGKQSQALSVSCLEVMGSPAGLCVVVPRVERSFFSQRIPWCNMSRPCPHPRTSSPPPPSTVYDITSDCRRLWQALSLIHSSIFLALTPLKPLPSCSLSAGGSPVEQATDT